jgi:hypothetical protein
MQPSILVKLVLGSLMAFGALADEAKSNSIVGVWKITEIDRDYEAAPNPDPLPSQIIFTKRYYSIVWLPGNRAIEAFETRWQPTDEEKIQRFGEIVVNTGTYEVDGEFIRVIPSIARMPEFIGGSMTYEFEWSGEKLVLTLVDEYAFDGVKAPWVEESAGQIHLTLTREDDT